MRDHRLTLAADGSEWIHSAGDYVRVRASDGPIKLETIAGVELTVREGEAARLVPFEGLRVINQHTGAQNIELSIGTGAIESARGVVTLDTVPQVQYPTFTARIEFSLVGGRKSAVQLKNPSTSGVIAYIYRIIKVSEDATPADYTATYRMDPTEADLADSGIYVGGESMMAFDSDTATPGTALERHYEGAVSWPTSVPRVALASYAEIENYSLGTDGFREIDFSRRPVTLRPGQSLISHLNAVDATYRVSFEYEERAA